MRLNYRVRIGIISALIVIFFLALNLTPFGKEVKNFFYLVSSPIQKWFWGAGDKVSDFFEFISEMKNLKRENEELKLKIQELLTENISLKELKKENEILREALDAGIEKEFEITASQAIGKDVSRDFILINKGSRDGILENFPVITQQKVLVGKVSEVYKNFSHVLLISNPKSVFDAKILAPKLTEGYTLGGDSEILGVVKGKGNLKIFLDLIPQEKEIKKGDLVITSALGGVFPEGLLVGEIEEVKKSDIEVWQKAEIKPAFDIKKTEILFVITSF